MPQGGRPHFSRESTEGFRLVLDCQLPGLRAGAGFGSDHLPSSAMHIVETEGMSQMVETQCRKRKFKHVSGAGKGW